MGTCNRRGRRFFIAAMLATMPGICGYSYAGISGDGYWVIERGDSVYSIARKVFPGDAAKQRQFRKALIEDNKDVFRGNPAHINVGDRLRLPAFAVSQPVDVAVPPEPEAVPVVEAVVEKKPETVTPDPEEIIGRVVVSVGKMQASNRGSFRDLLRNSRVYKGDTLVTASNSYTQVRMKDGALISLRPNTELVIREYNYNGKEDGSEKSFMELVRGGFRTITGYIGHKNRNNYRVRTSVATIGIRGTHYGLMLCSAGSCAGEETPLEDGVYGGVVDGSIQVKNDSGSYIFNNDQYFHVASDNAPAQELLMPPPVFHGRSDSMMGRANDRRTEADSPDGMQAGDKGGHEKTNLRRQAEGRLKSLTAGMKGKKPGSRMGALVMSALESRPPQLVLPDQINDAIKDAPKVDLEQAPDGSGLLIALNDTYPGSTASLMVNPSTQTEILLGSKQLADGAVVGNLPVAIKDIGIDTNGALAAYKAFLPSAVAGISDIGGDPIGVNWGRWDASYEFTINDVPQTTQGPLHYIYSDQITSPSQLTALSGLLGSKTYSYIAGTGTRPTTISGQAASLNTVQMDVDFAASTVLNYSIQVSLPENNVVVDMALDTAAGPVLFDNMGDMTLMDVSCNNCSGKASAAFVGPNAEGAITSYNLSNKDVGEGIQGTAVLKQGPPQF